MNFQIEFKTLLKLSRIILQAINFVGQDHPTKNHICFHEIRPIQLVRYGITQNDTNSYQKHSIYQQNYSLAYYPIL